MASGLCEGKSPRHHEQPMTGLRARGWKGEAGAYLVCSDRPAGIDEDGQERRRPDVHRLREFRSPGWPGSGLKQGHFFVGPIGVRTLALVPNISPDFSRRRCFEIELRKTVWPPQSWRWPREMHYGSMHEGSVGRCIANAPSSSESVLCCEEGPSSQARP